MKYTYIYNSTSKKGKVHLINRYGNTFCRQEHAPLSKLDRRSLHRPPTRSMCEICTFLAGNNIHRAIR